MKQKYLEPVEKIKTICDFCGKECNEQERMTGPSYYMTFATEDGVFDACNECYSKIIKIGSKSLKASKV
jgi:hypothetical protein